MSTETPLRTRIWYRLADVKFKALYACECARKADQYDRVLSVGLAFCTSASVAAWSFWQRHNTVWAVIIGVSQILLVARPYLPFLKNEAKYLSVSFELEALYLRYEQLWYSLEKNPGDSVAAANLFDELNRNELEIEKHGPQFPKTRRWMMRINAEKDSALRIDFPTMS